MPILAWGAFTAQTTGPENAFVKNKATEFSFKPVNLGLGLVFIFALIGLLLQYRQGGKHYSRWRWLALLPGLLGVVLALFSGENETLLLFIPLQLVTLLLILWKVFHLKNILLMHLVGFIFSVFLLWLNIVLKLSWSVANEVPTILLGAMVYLSCFLFLLLNRKKKSLKRWFIGLLLGIGIPTGGVSVYFIAFLQAPVEAIYVILGFIAFLLVPFAILARWNAWTRDIVSGEIYDKIRK